LLATAGGALRLGLSALACAATLAHAQTTAPPPASAPEASRQAQPMSADPALEARVMKVAEELRCLVCQNETIAASHADLAVDLRKQIRLKLSQGQSERQILDFMVERYGDFVLYRPPVKSTTLLLWFGPALMLLLGFGALAVVLRRRARASAAQFEPDDPAVFADPHQS
jgi:cytochrome c-type biogenesis protein CcmH